MMFKFYRTDDKTKEKIFSLGIVLENGEIHIVESADTSNYQSWKLQRDHKKDYKPVGIPGDIQFWSNDPDQFKANLFLSAIDKKD